MIKYYASLRFGSSTLFSFRVEKETPKRYYVDKASVKHLKGSFGPWQTYIEKGSPCLYDTAKDALEGLIKKAAQDARGAYKAYQSAKSSEEELTALRNTGPFV